MTMLSRVKTIGIALVISSVFVLIPGCEKKGSAEKAGEKIDNVMESISEKVEEAGDSLSNDGPAENMGEKLDDAAEDAGEKIKEAGDKIQNAVNGD